MLDKIALPQIVVPVSEAYKNLGFSVLKHFRGVAPKSREIQIPSCRGMGLRMITSLGHVFEFTETEEPRKDSYYYGSQEVKQRAVYRMIELLGRRRETFDQPLEEIADRCVVLDEISYIDLGTHCHFSSIAYQIESGEYKLLRSEGRYTDIRIFNLY